MFEQIPACVSFWHSAANMVFIACYCLVFDLTTYPPRVTADVCVRIACTWLLVHTDIFPFNLGKPHHHFLELSIVSLWDNDCLRTDYWWLSNLTGNTARIIRSRKEKGVLVLPRLSTNRIPEWEQTGARSSANSLKLFKQSFTWSHLSKSLLPFIGKCPSGHSYQ